jgi:hypothetical protein
VALALGGVPACWLLARAACTGRGTLLARCALMMMFLLMLLMLLLLLLTHTHPSAQDV